LIEPEARLGGIQPLENPLIQRSKLQLAQFPAPQNILRHIRIDGKTMPKKLGRLKPMQSHLLWSPVSNKEQKKPRGKEQQIH
jgi:hypothetical protein